MLNRNFLENGSNDFPDFWPEVGGQYSKKVVPAGFFSKNPVLLDLGLTVCLFFSQLTEGIWTILAVTAPIQVGGVHAQQILVPSL